MKTVRFSCDHCNIELMDTAIGVRIENGVVQSQRVQAKKFDFYDKLFCSWEHQGKYMEEEEGGKKE